MYCLDLVFGCLVLLLAQLQSHFHSMKSGFVRYTAYVDMV
jgi:hypothetical protein